MGVEIYNTDMRGLPQSVDEAHPRRNYKWPWFVLAAVLLFLALAILWMSIAAKKVEQERGVDAPSPTGAK